MMDSEGVAERMTVGFQNFSFEMVSLPSWENFLLLCLALSTIVYHMLGFHIVGDILNGLRGDPVRLYYSRKSRLAQLLIPKLEVINRRFAPTPWLCSPHLQTIFLEFFPSGPHVQYHREIFRAPDGGTIALDWANPTNYPEDRNPGDGQLNSEVPIVIVVPGLTSDSSLPYVRHTVAELTKQGWRVVVANHRGLAGLSMTAKVLYNAGWTEDLRETVLHVQENNPKAPLLGVGCSLGANIMVKYLGEEGANTPLGAAAAICCPWDLLLCDRFMAQPGVQNIYNRVLTDGLIQMAEKNKAHLSDRLDWELLVKSRTIRDFDDSCTRMVGQYKYETVDTFYRRAGSVNYVPGVSVPLLGISALDDPICTAAAIPTDECSANPNIILAVTKHGGHLGFFEGLNAESIWFTRATTDYFKTLLGSSLLHVQSKVKSQFDVFQIGKDMDKGPYLAFSEDHTVAATDSEAM